MPRARRWETRAYDTNPDGSRGALMHETVTREDLPSMNAVDLRAAYQTLYDEATRLHQDQHGQLRQLSEEETRRFEEVVTLMREVEQHLRIREAHDRNPDAVERFGARQLSRMEAFDIGPAEVLGQRPDAVRSRALKALEVRGRHLSTRQQDEMARLLDASITHQTPNVDGSYIAKRTLITESDAYRSAFAEVVSNPYPVLTGEEADALRALRRLDAEQRAMSEGTPSAGGVGVPVFIDPTIVLTAQGPLNPVARISRNETITTNQWKGVSSAGVTWSWDAEGVEVSDDSPVLAQPTVPVSMARGFVPYSIEVGQDYPGLAEELARLLAEGYEDLVAQSLTTGSGSGQPRGIITALDANTSSEVTLTTAGSFGAVDINKTWKALPDRFKGNATWVMSHDLGADVASFANAQNLASFYTVNLTGVITTLRTRPVEFSSYFPGSVSGTSHQNQIVVGDFSRYLIARRAGMALEPVPMLVGTNHRPTAQRGAFAWARVGADSISDTAFRLLNQT
jgi:HK97 family phage major capsid protein